MDTAIQAVKLLIDDLPESASWDDIMHELEKYKIDLIAAQRLAGIDKNTILTSHEEMLARYK